MAAAFAGKWKMDKTDNAEAFMKATDAPEEIWKKVNEAKPTFEFAVNGNKWHVKNDILKMDHEFELGKENDHVGPDGRKSKNISSFDGGKLITESKLENGKNITMTRWVEGDRMLCTMKVGDCIMKNEFVRV